MLNRVRRNLGPIQAAASKFANVFHRRGINRERTQERTKSLRPNFGSSLLAIDFQFGPHSCKVIFARFLIVRGGISSTLPALKLDRWMIQAAGGLS